MPVVINEVEVLQPAPPAPAPAPAVVAHQEPADDLRRWLQDLTWREHRLVAD